MPDRRDFPRLDRPNYVELGMANSRLDNKFAKFMRVKRGDMTFQQFSDKIGLPPSTLHRLEKCQQSVTLATLEKICKQLKCSVVDIFGK